MHQGLLGIALLLTATPVATAQNPLETLGSLTANDGIYANTIPVFASDLGYTEVCFKNGDVFNDQHPLGGADRTTAGGNCIPGDIGWVIEQAERGDATWTTARADCLVTGMRLPGAFEYQYSC